MVLRWLNEMHLLAATQDCVRGIAYNTGIHFSRQEAPLKVLCRYNPYLERRHSEGEYYFNGIEHVISVSPYSRNKAQVVRHEAGHFFLVGAASNGSREVAQDITTRSFQHPLDQKNSQNPVHSVMKHHLLNQLIHEVFAYYCQGLLSEDKSETMSNSLMNVSNYLFCCESQKRPIGTLLFEDSFQPTSSILDSLRGNHNRNVISFKDGILDLVELYEIYNPHDLARFKQFKDITFEDVKSYGRDLRPGRAIRKLEERIFSSERLKDIKTEEGMKMFLEKFNLDVHILGEWYGFNLARAHKRLAPADVVNLFAFGDSPQTRLASTSYNADSHLAEIIELAEPSSLDSLRSERIFSKQFEDYNEASKRAKPTTPIIRSSPASTPTEGLSRRDRRKRSKE